MTNDKLNINIEMQSFLEGKNCRAYRFLGSRHRKHGTEFRVWAKNADECFVSFDSKCFEMERRGEFFHLYLKNIHVDGGYRYILKKDGICFEKNDPFAHAVNEERFSEVASIDDITPDFMIKNDGVMRIFEFHPGTYAADFDSIAESLPSYVKKLGFTHVELMPIFSHPCKESWGYQATGYFSFEYGSAQSFSRLVKTFHDAGIGVIIDLPPGHFANDSYALAEFDGSCLFESADKKLSQNLLWGTVNTDFSKGAVRSYMLSSACFLADVFGIDGVRIDAVANVLFKRFNEYGSQSPKGDINLDSVTFLRELTDCLRKRGVLTIAEDSSTEINSTAPSLLGGLGFDRKQNLGWYHDTNAYFSYPPPLREQNGHLIKKPFSYAKDENFILPISHDENTHGKGTLASRMKDKKNQKLMLFYMYTFPGDKMIFDGCERGAMDEWNPGITNRGTTEGIEEFVHKLNDLCGKCTPLGGDFGEMNFKDGVLSFLRTGSDEDDFLISVINTVQKDFEEYKIGINRFTDFKVIFSTECHLCGMTYTPEAVGADDCLFSLKLKLPALSAVLLKPEFAWKNK